MTKEERLWSYIDKRGPDECWPISGSVQIGWAGEYITKRRAVWLTTNGRIPKRLNLITRCGNGSCGNPAHLSLGTMKESSAITLKLGRSTSGVRNLHAKLTDEKVIEVRRLAANGVSDEQLAAMHKVNKSTICEIRLRRTWKHI